MPLTSESIDQSRFKQIMLRNVVLPLLMAIVTSGSFVFVILHLVSVSHWVDHTDQVIGKGHQLLQIMVDAETGYRGFLLTGDDAFLEPYVRAEEQLEPTAKELKAIVTDNPAQAVRVDRVLARQHDWQSIAERLIEDKRAQRDVVKSVREEHGKRLMDAIRAEMGTFLQVEEGLRTTRTQEASRTVTLSLAIILAVGAITGILIALNGRRQLRILSGSYELVLEKQVEQNRALEKQAWIKNCQNDLNLIVRDNKDFGELALRLLSFLAEKLDARVGSLYASQIDGSLMRAAGFGLADGQSDSPVRYQLGQTLVGQAALEKRPVIVEGVESKYLKISSALMEVPPSVIVVAPAMSTDNIVRAVYELGLTRPLDPRSRELIAAASEIIGSAIRSAQDEQRLRELLEETQRQSEELQAQQEELRVNNEELEEQSNALKESQSRLEGQQAELEQTNSQLEEQQRSLELQTDALAERNAELEEARASIEDKARQLEQASVYKSQFLANMSHELRTPLNSTLILAKLLKDNKEGNLTNEQVEMAETISAAGNDLLALINDVLDLAKVEAGKIDLHAEPIPLSRLTGDLERVFRPQADNKKIRLEFEMRPDLPRSIETDKLRVEQILRNLLSNAIKFTEEGGVKVVLSKASGEPAMIEIAITDTGIGIASHQQQVVFEAFKQADGTTNRKYGGTGLGLAISRDLAALLGGRIELQSAPCEGSTFTLILPEKLPEIIPTTLPATPPAVPSDHTPMYPPKPPTVRAKKTDSAKSTAPGTTMPRGPGVSFDDLAELKGTERVLLIVEDDESFAKILVELGRELGFKCVVAPTAEDGVALARELLPQALLLDILLPDHSGLTVLDRLKDNPKTRHIPVHVISASDYSQAALQMGAIGYLVKPSTRTELVQAISKLEQKLEQNLRQVLVVEDNLVQLESIKKLIQTDKVQVTAVSKGAEALHALQTNPNFDCMIVDLSLPDMSGYQLLESMALGNTPHHPPVIIYTGRALTRDEETQLQKYSRSIIIKGARSPERLLSEVTLFLHQVESSLPRDRQEMLSGLRNRDQAFESRKLLIVDDDVRNIFALTSALEPKGAKIEIARNGREALAKLESVPDVDLVLMDIMMPEMDGHEAMRHIRRNDRLKNLPIIAITAKAMREDHDLCLAAGASDYLAKPIDLEKLLSLIRVWMPTQPRGR